MLTPVDIENKEFAKAFRGYDSVEVDEFMRSLVTDYEKLYRENGTLKEKNDMLSDTLANYKGMESTMQNAILVAQKTAEDIKQNAYERSDTIIKEAEMKAVQAISASEKRVVDLEKSYKELQHEMNAFKARMNSLLNTYLQLLSDLPGKEQTISKNERYENAGTISDNMNKNIYKARDIENSEVINEDNCENSVLKKDVNIETEDNDSKAYTNDNTAASQPEADDNRQGGKSYSPKNINPLVDELLKKREAEIVDEKQIAPDAEEENKTVPDEIIIDISGKNKNISGYDVFKDESL